MIEAGSKDVCKAAIRLAMSSSRKEEDHLKERYTTVDIKTAAVDYGGDFLSSVTKIIERAVVAAKREGLIEDNHKEEGAVAGAAREALAQITQKAIGLNIGGKIGIARHEDHIAVTLFVGIGLLHLNEVAMGLGHRSI